MGFGDMKIGDKNVKVKFGDRRIQNELLMGFYGLIIKEIIVLRRKRK